MTRDPAAQLAPADLENTELPLEGRIDLGTLLCSHDLFTDIINPERRDGDGQQEMIEAFGIREFSRFQIKTAGLIIAETLFDVHALQVVFQGALVSRLIQSDGTQLGGLFGCGARPSHGQITAPSRLRRLSGQFLKIARATRRDAQRVNGEYASVRQGHGGVIRDPDAVIPVQFPAFFGPILVAKAAVG